MIYLIDAVNIVFQVYTLMIFVRIIASWIPQVYEYKIMHFIMFYTDPYLNFFRKFIPPLGMMDFSPIIAFLCLSFIQGLVINLLRGMA